MAGRFLFLNFQYGSITIINPTFCRGDIRELKLRQVFPQLLLRALQGYIALELTGGRQTFQHGLSEIEVARMEIGHEVIGGFNHKTRPSFDQKEFSYSEITMLFEEINVPFLGMLAILISG